MVAGIDILKDSFCNSVETGQKGPERRIGGAIAVFFDEIQAYLIY